MIELLRAAATEAPDRIALDSPSTELSYAELVEAAEVAAAALRERQIERFAVLLPSLADLWPVLAAASLAGVEACVYPVAAPDDAIAEFRDRFDHATVVSTRSVPGDGVLTPADLAGGGRFDGEAPEVRPHLVLTSGTTSGKPQAARHDWSRLLRVAERIRPAGEQRWLLAYAPNQFAGLQVLIHVAAARATLVVGESFQPRDALAALRRGGVTHVSATPTLWRFLLAELKAEGEPPPALRQITLGGEPVPTTLLSQLAEAFPTAKISQLYAATEIGASVSVRDGVAGLPASVLESGGDVDFKIVDGELWVRSTSTMLGYYGDPPVVADAWRATGDMVEIVGDRVEFRGRSSDVINVGGVKVQPLPVEDRVAAVDGVAMVRAFGRANRLVGQILALEIVPEADIDEEALRGAIRSACADLPPSAQPRSITFVSTIDAPAGKIRRGVKA